MRLVEKCCCGGSIEVAWSQPKSNYDRVGSSEAERAKAELAIFRKRHKVCTSSVEAKA